MIDKLPELPSRAPFQAFKPSASSKIHIATPEDTQSFQAHCAAYHSELAPNGPIERDLVQLIAEDRWRLKRAHCIENSLFARGINQHAHQHDTGRFEVDDALAEGQTWIDQSRYLTALTQYEQRVQRSIKENTAALNVRQMERKQACQQAQKEAIMLAAVAESQGEAYDPAPDFANPADCGGFVFDPSETARLLDRGHRMDQAFQLMLLIPSLPKVRPQAA
jgi:hypothetical protein